MEGQSMGCEKSHIPLVVLVGPTAVGKSAIAVEIAKRLNGEIVSADSMQVYRYMDIGTAKPTIEERKGVPHHMIDFLDPGILFNVAEYQRMADEIIEDINHRGRLPILVGGTGLYVKAAVDGFLFPDSGQDLKIREDLEKMAAQRGNQFLYDKLSEVDPLSAQRIHVNDLRRIIRALEVYRTTGRPISEQQKGWEAEESRYNMIMIGLTMERKALYRRIEERVDSMVEAGLVEEVKELLAMGYSERLTSVQALGYKEIISYLEGEHSLEEAIEIIKRDTRRYAKRQLTWFKRDKRIIWISIDKNSEVCETVQEIVEIIEDKLLSR